MWIAAGTSEPLSTERRRPCRRRQRMLYAAADNQVFAAAVDDRVISEAPCRRIRLPKG